MRYEIVAVRRPEHHAPSSEHITDVKIADKSFPRSDIIRWIETREHEFFVRVRDQYGRVIEVRVIVAVRLGVKYIKTEADTTTVDNLLSLPRY